MYTLRGLLAVCAAAAASALAGLVATDLQEPRSAVAANPQPPQPGGPILATMLYQLNDSGPDAPSRHPGAQTSKENTAAIHTPQFTSGADEFDMARMLCLVNRLRAAHGMSPVAYHSKLQQLARNHAAFQAANRMVTHMDSAGTLGDRLHALGFQWRVLAENVGVGATGEDAIMAAWAASPHHRANLLHPDFRYIGVAVSRGYWAQDFAAPIDATPLPLPGDLCPSSPDTVVIHT